jgi:hypothetical protein
MVMPRLALDKTGGADCRPVLPILFGLGIASGAVYLFNFKIQALAPLFSRLNEVQVYLIQMLFLSILYLGAVLLVLKNLATIGNSRVVLGLIIFFAIFSRLCLVPAVPTVLSQDMYRYVWDGRVQQVGINPYLYPPAAPELENLRDDPIFPRINRKQYPTIYPAAAQISFRLFHALVGDSVVGYKGGMVFFDILTLLALTGLLTAYGFEPARIIVYAWNPLVIFEIAFSGHLEGLTVFFMVLAFYLHAGNKKKSGVMMLAVAAALKIYPALLLAPLLNRGRRIRDLFLFGATLVLLYLPYANAGPKIIGFLPIYLNNPYESFNLGLQSLLLRLLPTLDYALLSKFSIFVLLTAGISVFLKEKQEIQILRASYWLTGLLLLFMPASLHPWYVILIIPFLAFFPNPAWLIFTTTVSLSYLKYVSPGEIMPTWVLSAEYLPLLVLPAAGWLFMNKDRYTCLPALFYDRRLIPTGHKFRTSRQAAQLSFKKITEVKK